MGVDRAGSAGPCGGLGGLPKNFLQPCLLLLLKEERGYGYDLVVRLKALGLDDDSPTVYRALRSLEENGAVTSYWSTSSTGPARRMYRLTPFGAEQLQASVDAALDTHEAIERFFCRQALAVGRPLESDTVPSGSSAPTLRRLLRKAGSTNGLTPPA